MLESIHQMVNIIFTLIFTFDLHLIQFYSTILLSNTVIWNNISMFYSFQLIDFKIVYQSINQSLFWLNIGLCIIVVVNIIIIINMNINLFSIIILKLMIFYNYTFH